MSILTPNDNTLQANIFTEVKSIQETKETVTL